MTLLGDAAHPMYPIGSNGASQAVIDGRVLAWELARHEHPVQALAAYDAARREATAALVLANRQMGPEKVLRIVSERAPDGFDSVEDVMSAAELAAIARDYKLTAGFEVDALNERPSWDVAGVSLPWDAARFQNHRRGIGKWEAWDGHFEPASSARRCSQQPVRRKLLQPHGRRER